MLNNKAVLYLETAENMLRLSRKAGITKDESIKLLPIIQLYTQLAIATQMIYGKQKS